MDEWLLRLLATSLSGCVVIGVLWLACRSLTQLSGKTRCWLWWLACLKLVLGLISLPVISLPVLSQPVTPSFNFISSDKPNSTESLSENITTPSKPVEEMQPSQAFEKEEFASGSSAFPWLTLLGGIWLVGVGIGIGMQAMALLQLRRLAAGAERITHSLLPEVVKAVGLTYTPALYVTSSPIEPLTVGWFRPFILISQETLNRLTTEELRSVLTHECVHIRRGDLLLSLVPWLAQTLFWYLPPIHFAVREYQLSREAACDQQTITALSVLPRSYGELLVKLSSPASPLTTPSSVMALSADFRQLKRRIEMLEIQRTRRSILVAAALVTATVLIPWRLTAAPQSGVQVEALPNLDMARGLSEWKPYANGSTTDPHPFYTVGQDKNVTHDGKPSAFVRSTEKSEYDGQGDGGVLRYDIVKTARKYAGKRMRLSAYVRGTKLTRKAFLFIAAEAMPNMLFASSANITPGSKDWQRLECVMDIPENAQGLSIGLRLEGEGTAYGSEFHLESVDKSVPTNALTVIDVIPGPSNLNFEDGLDSWWNDDPTHTAGKEYDMSMATKAGRSGGPAAYLKNKVANPKTYGTIGQNAAPKQYLGKRVRFSAYLKTENADMGELWIVVSDKDPEKGDAWNAETTGKTVKGTKDWTKISYEIDIPKTTDGLSFGISSTGKGTVWVDGFQFEILGPSQK